MDCLLSSNINLSNINEDMCLNDLPAHHAHYCVRISVLNFYLKINWWIRWLNSGWVFFWEFFKGFNNIDSHNFKTNYTKHEHQNSYFSPNWWDPWGSDLGPHYAIISLWWAIFPSFTSPTNNETCTLESKVPWSKTPQIVCTGILAIWYCTNWFG